MMQFSIIIPAKNEVANIGRCLDSLAHVDWDQSQYEIIVVDNGSSDGTVEIAREKGAQVYIEPELSISGLRNFGARHASGEILSFLDADCTVMSSWLENASLYLMNKEVACFGSPPIVPVDATWVQNTWFVVRKKSAELCETDWLESMNMFIRREAFASIGGFDESLVTCEDYDLSVRLRRLGKIVSDCRIVAVHHGEAATVSHFLTKELWRGTSNFQGILNHGLTWEELPSILLPSIYLLCLVSFFCCLPAGILNGHGAMIIPLILLFAGWQLPVIALLVRYNREWLCLGQTVQLYFLLNAYLFARGGAMVFNFRH